MGIHDQLFKQLLSLFFWEFISLFLPAFANYLTNFTLEEGNERHLVKLNCEFMLAKLNLNENEARLIGKFLEVYLTLSTRELEKYQQEINKLTEPEKEEIMELYTSYELKGMKLGRIEVLAELLADRLESMNEHVVDLIGKLSDAQLKEFRRSIFSFNSLPEAEKWLESKVNES